MPSYPPRRNQEAVVSRTILAALFVALLAPALAAQEIGVKERTLSNGMTVPHSVQ